VLGLGRCKCRDPSLLGVQQLLGGHGFQDDNAKFLAVMLVEGALAAPNKEVYLLAFNKDGSAASFSGDQISATFFAGGLSSAQMANLASRINNLHDGLGRECLLGHCGCFDSQ
jgi:hypothetical protein